MHYVIIRDDDTNSATPPECLEILYRPFLDRGLPVNLAVIPSVSTAAITGGGAPEEFLWNRARGPERHLPMEGSSELAEYLTANKGFNILQHGCFHDYFEFNRSDRGEICGRLDLGRKILQQSGLGVADTFVAPHDKLSRVAYHEVSARFRVISTGWFELRRVPFSWWPRYLLKKISNKPHWRVSNTFLLSHPGCLLSRSKPVFSILPTIEKIVRENSLTVLVTHWWEYFPKRKPADELVQVLHDTAELLSSKPNIRVISFGELAAKPSLFSGIPAVG